MIWKASAVLIFALCVLSDGHPVVSEPKVELHFTGQHGDLSHVGHQELEHHEAYASAYPSYEFSYQVNDPHTHDKKAQDEERDGDKVTGNYWLIQPDGEKRYIKYHVDDKSGFTAVINYTSPHSSVYIMKHREEAGKSKTEKKKEKGKEELQSTRQEGEEKKQEGNKIEEKHGQGKKDSNEQPESKDRDHQQEGERNHPQNVEKRGDEIRRYDDNWNWYHHRGHNFERDYTRNGDNDHDNNGHGGEGSRRIKSDRDSLFKGEDKRNEGRVECHDISLDREQSQGGNRGDENSQSSSQHNKGDRDGRRKGEDKRQGGRDGGQDKGQNQRSRVSQKTGKQVVNKHTEVQYGDKQEDKKDEHKHKREDKKDKILNLWTGLPGWTITHDHPESHEKPVWEWDEDHLWPNHDNWNERRGEHRGERQDGNENNGRGDRRHSEGEIDNEQRYKSELRKDSVERRNDEQHHSSKKRGGDDNVPRGGNENREGGEQLLGVEERKSSHDRRDGAVRRRGSEQRRGGDIKAGSDERRGDQRRDGENRGHTYRRGQPSNIVNFSPYGQRY